MIGYFLVLVALHPSNAVSEQPKIVEMQKVATELRKDRGLVTQTLNEELCALSQKWAEHMAKNHSMYHGGGENIIAAGYKTPRSAFNGWLSSPGHSYWVLSGADQCGWGAAQSSTGTWYWVGAFRNSAVVKSPPVTYVPRRRLRLFKRR